MRTTTLLWTSLLLCLSTACASPTAPSSQATVVLHLVHAETGQPLPVVATLSLRTADNGQAIPSVTTVNGTARFAVPLDRTIWVQVDAPGFHSGSEPIRTSGDVTLTWRVHPVR